MSLLTNHAIEDKVMRNAEPQTLSAFQGVYPIDQLPKYISHFPIFIVVNTQSHNLPGRHWVTVFIDRNKYGEIFDSLCLPVPATLYRWMNRMTRRWTMNVSAPQDPRTMTCGSFAVFYILNRLHVANLATFMNVFRDKACYNENIVHMYFSKLK